MKKSKRELEGTSKTALVALLLFLTICSSSISVVRSSTNRVCIFISPAAYVAQEIGENFWLEVVVQHVVGLHCCDFTIEYNNSLLDITLVAKGDFFPQDTPFTYTKNASAGTVTVNISPTDPRLSWDGNGTLAKLDFQVIQAARGRLSNEGYPISFIQTHLFSPGTVPIDHQRSDALFFWRSVQGDPPIGGRLLDASTQKGGIGQSVFGGTFKIGDNVECYANVTYNGYPVQSQLVSFEVLNPLNSPILVQASITNSDGLATMDFRIPSLLESVGTWTIFSSTQLADNIVWDFVTFEVFATTPRPPVANFIEIPQSPFVNQQVYFDASASTPGFDGDDICPITEYRWDFGDGNQTNMTTPIIYHTYLHTGIYYVTLTVYAPGIPSFIDPHYVDTNTTYPPERKVVNPIPVGGYTLTFQQSARTSPMVPYFALTAMLAIGFATLRRKKILF